ncbi:MAG: hypothetical protein K9N34_07300 [Candidatus Marinimicrobia bacterium]|nr:hypothetical protein [Candidatus Neomarinimicrobiota bacterium]MCF7840844.1 hypothetical protein [Candidatus Neomarinimicrobiota bacterium]MCF7902752.1 hypothetical protein [Candidatus Neomarinimicrobiota bacterium]
MRQYTFLPKQLIRLAVFGILATFPLLAQLDTKPLWYQPDMRSDNVLQGFGSGEDFSATVLSALSDLARHKEYHLESITTEDAEGYRETARQQFGAVLVIDTLIVMSRDDEDQMTQQTQVIYQDGEQRYLALQTLTSYPESERGRWQIIADNCDIHAVITALQSAGIDIKKQVVPTGVGYQFYIRMQLAMR